MARCEGAFLFLMDMALAAAGHRFDIVEIPDFLHLGALLPFALRHSGSDSTGLSSRCTVRCRML